MSSKRKVIIDCDPGIDDSLALMLALVSPEIEVVGITIVSGNVHISKGVKNALRVLKLMDSLHIPVYVGDGKPIVRELVTAEDTHGEDGLGETFMEEVLEGNIKENAVDFILNQVESGDTSIIALGPLTNLAQAMKKNKEKFNKVQEIVIMGGAFKSHGNCSPVAEFNFWVDPHGAKYVFDNVCKPIKMVGLDVTREVVLTPNYRELLNQINNKYSKFIVDITRFYVDFHWKQEKTLGCVINDPLAVAYFINRDLCKGFDAYVDIATEGISLGQSVVDVANFYNKKPNCHVLTEVNNTDFMEMFLTRLFPENKKHVIDILRNKKYGI